MAAAVIGTKIVAWLSGFRVLTSMGKLGIVTGNGSSRR